MKRTAPRFVISRFVLIGLVSFIALAAVVTFVVSASRTANSGGGVSPARDQAQNTRATKPLTRLADGKGVNPLAVSITATLADDITLANKKLPGDTITYTLNVTNSGTTDATGINFSDIVDSHTTLLAGSGVLAVDDAYNTIGNVNINVAAPGLLTNDRDITAGNNTGMTTTAATVSSSQCAACNNVTINSNGSFTYDPPVGFTGTDTFTYTAVTSGGKTATATARITVSGKLWFINDNAGACTLSCDGRLSHPFQTLAAFQALNDNGVALTHPKTGDSIFLYESATSYVGPVTLLSTQKFIGQDATASLITLTGLTQPSGTDPLPAMNTGAPAVTITSASNGINLGSGNTLRGFTVGATTGTKISGTSFGTLLVGDSTLPDVTLSGNGQALNLTTGTFANTSKFVSVASSSSTTSGLTLTSVAGTVAFGSTTISGNNNECLITTSSTADINFGNTSCTANVVSLSGNTGGTRTFGTLSVTGGAGNAFSHSGGGGNVTVNGLATLSSVAPDTVVIQNAASGNQINFAGGATVNKTGAGGEAVQWSGTNTGATLTFATLALTTSNATGMSLSGGGTVNVTTAAGSSISATGDATHNGAAIIANGIALGANFTTVSSTNNAFAGSNGVSLTTVTGTSSLGGGTLTGAAGATFLVSGGTTSVTYVGGIAQGNNAAAVSVAGGHNGTLTFNTGTISATNGTGLQFDNADGTYNFNGTNTLGGGDAGIDILNGSAGTFNFSSNSTITSPSGTAFNVGTSPTNPSVTYSGSITQNTSGQRVVNIDGTTGNTITFQTGTITGGASSTGVNINNANGNVTFSNGMTMGTSGSRMTNQAVTITNGTGTYSLGAVSIFTSNAEGIVATNADGTVNTTSGTVDAANRKAINIDGPAGLTTLGVTLTKVTSTSSTSNGIFIQDTNGSFTLAGDGGGSNNGSGGAISSATNEGVILNNVSNISLGYMNITSSGDSGIKGTSVNNFTLNRSNVTSNGNSTGNGTTIDDDGIQLGNQSGSVVGVTGNATITNCDVSGNAHNNVHFRSTSGTLTLLTVTNSTFNNLNDTFGANSFLYEASGTSITTEASMTGCTFSNNSPQRALEVQTHDTATIGNTGTSKYFVVSGGTFTGNGIHASFTQDTSSNLAFKLLNSTITTPNTADNVLQAVNVFSSSQSTGGTIVGVIQGNTINTNQETISGIDGVIQGRTNATLLIDNNTVTGASNQGNRGISFGFRGPTAALMPTTTHNITITNNNVNNVTGATGCTPNPPPTCTVGVNFFPLAAINIEADNQSGSFSTAPTVRADIRSNTVPSSSAFDLTSGNLQFYEYDGDATPNEAADGIGQLVDNAPASADANAELSSHNTGSVAAVGISLIAGPINNPPLARPDDGGGAEEIQASNASLKGGSSSLLTTFPWQNQLTGSTAAFVGNLAFLHTSDSLMTRAAITTELPSTETSASPVTVAVAGASGQSKQAAPMSARLKQVLHPVASFAAQMVFLGSRIDNWLTPSGSAAPSSGSESAAAIAPATAEVNSVDSTESTQQKGITPNSGETFNASIGTLHAGESAQITFQVTVDTPPLVKSVSTQGSVTGSNFTVVNGISTTPNTNDPETAAVNDATVTNLNVTSTWTGATSTDWNTITNWTPNTYAPGVTNPGINDVVIPNVGNQPTIGTTDVTVFSLNISNGRTLTITSPRILTIGGAPGGNLTLDGVISGSELRFGTGTHSFTGAGAGSISSDNLLTVLSGATVTLNQNFSVGRLAVNAGGSMDISNRTLTLTGPGAALAAVGTFTTTGSTVAFASTTGAQTTGTVYNNLTINNAAGVTLTADSTVNGALALTSGDLLTGTFTLTQPNSTASTGTGDVVGNVKRTGAPLAATALTYGNPNNVITLGANTLTSLNVKLTKTAPTDASTGITNSGFPGAVQRTYVITPAGGTFTTATLRLHYLDTELNSNTEGSLRLWKYITTPTTGWQQQDPPGALTTFDSTANWVQKTGVTGFSPWTIAGVSPTAANGHVSGQILDHNGHPVEGAVVRLSGTQNRKFITDSNGNYRFDNVETNGFYTVTPSRVNFVFSPSQRSFSQLGNNTDAAFSATATSGTALNPLDTPEYFVRQQYLDFLGREPDESGFNFWSDQILACNSDAACIEGKRINVSAAFFLSIEFQQTGYLVYRMYQAAYGDIPGAPVPLRLGEFRPDTAEIGNGVVVLQGDWQDRLESNKQTFASEFVQRTRFTSLYAGMSDGQFVDTLNQNAGFVLSQSERDQLVSDLSTQTKTRAQVLRAVAENPVLTQHEFNQAFVLMQYFGYMQRDANAGPDTDFTGYNFWLDKLNTFGGNFQNAEMVRAFLVSSEYRGGFRGEGGNSHR